MYFLKLSSILVVFLTLLLSACSSDREPLIQDQNLTAVSGDRVDVEASGAYSYSWRQISGKGVVLINAHKATMSFIAPEVQKQELLTFELTASLSSSIENLLKERVRVTVLPRKDTDAAKENSSSPQDNNTTQPKPVILQSLKLTLKQTSLNVDTNTTLSVIATYDDNSSKDVTNEVEWSFLDPDVVQITQNLLYTKKDTNILLQASYKNITSNSVALEIYKEINGHKLPPQPDETINNSTLLGIDSNNNGVRDDVERWIFTEYDHPIVQAVAMQNARAFQIILIDPSKARETTKLMENQTDCQGYYWFQDSRKIIPRGKSLYKESKPLILNTRERNRAYYEYNQALSGGVYPGRPWDTFKSSCDFNETKILQGNWK